MIIRCPSASKIKLGAIDEALREALPNRNLQIQSFPVELQDRDDLNINAEPEGREQTLEYARERLKQMRLEEGAPSGIDISIENGIINGFDIACVVINSKDSEEAIAWSQGVAVPNGALEEARKRGLKTTTVGDIIHEKYPKIPAKDWHANFPPYISRQHQIREAIIAALRQILAP